MALSKDRRNTARSGELGDPIPRVVLGSQSSPVAASRGEGLLQQAKQASLPPSTQTRSEHVPEAGGTQRARSRGQGHAGWFALEKEGRKRPASLWVAGVEASAGGSAGDAPAGCSAVLLGAVPLSEVNHLKTETESQEDCTLSSSHVHLNEGKAQTVLSTQGAWAPAPGLLTSSRHPWRQAPGTSPLRDAQQELCQVDRAEVDGDAAGVLPSASEACMAGWASPLGGRQHSQPGCRLGPARLEMPSCVLALRPGCGSPAGKHTHPRARGPGSGSVWAAGSRRAGGGAQPPWHLPTENRLCTLGLEEAHAVKRTVSRVTAARRLLVTSASTVQGSGGRAGHVDAGFWLPHLLVSHMAVDEGVLHRATAILGPASWRRPGEDGGSSLLWTQPGHEEEGTSSAQLGWPCRLRSRGRGHREEQAPK